MTSLGFPGLSSQSISGFFGPFRPEKPETDWDDKPGLPRVVIPVGFGVFGFFRPENPETDWDDKAGLPRVVIPVRFWVFRPFRPENPETEWGDKPGLPRLVIPVRFRFFAAFFSPKTTKRIGMTSLGFPRLSSQSVFADGTDLISPGIIHLLNFFAPLEKDQAVYETFTIETHILATCSLHGTRATLCSRIH